MTHLFQVGDSVPASYSPTTIEFGHGRVYPGPGGIGLVLRVKRPTQALIAAVDRGAVSLGVRDRREGESALLLQVGEPDGLGSLEAVIDARSNLDGWNLAWWSEDVELALCDEAAVIRSVTGFIGPGRGFGDCGVGAGEARDVCTAVFPEHHYGLVQPRGLLDADVWVESALALVRAQTWQAGFSEVWDVREVDEIVLKASDIARLIRLEVETEQYLAESTSYVVIPSRQALTYSAKFYARLVRPLGRHVVVCQSAADAAQNLGIEELPRLDACDPPRVSALL